MTTRLQARNTNNEIELRRNCDRLISIGRGIMAFAVWTVVKTAGLYFYNRQAVFDYVSSEVPADASAADVKLYTNIAIVILAMFLLIIIAIQFYTGASAIAVGRSKKKKRLYLVFGILMLITSMLSVVQLIKNAFTVQAEDMPDIFKGSIVVELTYLILIFEMIYSASKVNKLLSMGKHSKTR